MALEILQKYKWLEGIKNPSTQKQYIEKLAYLIDPSFAATQLSVKILPKVILETSASLTPEILETRETWYPSVRSFIRTMLTSGSPFDYSRLNNLFEELFKDKDCCLEIGNGSGDSKKFLKLSDPKVLESITNLIWDLHDNIKKKRPISVVKDTGILNLCPRTGKTTTMIAACAAMMAVVPQYKIFYIMASEETRNNQMRLLNTIITSPEYIDWFNRLNPETPFVKKDLQNNIKHFSNNKIQADALLYKLNNNTGMQSGNINETSKQEYEKLSKRQKSKITLEAFIEQNKKLAENYSNNIKEYSKVEQKLSAENPIYNEIIDTFLQIKSKTKTKLISNMGNIVLPNGSSFSMKSPHGNPPIGSGFNLIVTDDAVLPKKDDEFNTNNVDYETVKHYYNKISTRDRVSLETIFPKKMVNTEQRLDVDLTSFILESKTREYTDPLTGDIKTKLDDGLLWLFIKPRIEKYDGMAGGEWVDKKALVDDVFESNKANLIQQIENKYNKKLDLYKKKKIKTMDSHHWVLSQLEKELLNEYKSYQKIHNLTSYFDNGIPLSKEKFLKTELERIKNEEYYGDPVPRIWEYESNGNKVSIPYYSGKILDKFYTTNLIYQVLYKGKAEFMIAEPPVCGLALNSVYSGKRTHEELDQLRLNNPNLYRTQYEGRPKEITGNMFSADLIKNAHKHPYNNKSILYWQLRFNTINKYNSGNPHQNISYRFTLEQCEFAEKNIQKGTDNEFYYQSEKKPLNLWNNTIFIGIDPTTLSVVKNKSDNFGIVVLGWDKRTNQFIVLEDATLEPQKERIVDQHGTKIVSEFVSPERAIKKLYEVRDRWKVEACNIFYESCGTPSNNFENELNTYNAINYHIKKINVVTGDAGDFSARIKQTNRHTDYAKAANIDSSGKLDRLRGLSIYYDLQNKINEEMQANILHIQKIKNFVSDNAKTLLYHNSRHAKTNDLLNPQYAGNLLSLETAMLRTHNQSTKSEGAVDALTMLIYEFARKKNAKKDTQKISIDSFLGLV